MMTPNCEAGVSGLAHWLGQNPRFKSALSGNPLVLLSFHNAGLLEAGILYLNQKNI